MKAPLEKTRKFTLLDFSKFELHGGGAQIKTIKSGPKRAWFGGD